MHIRPLLPPDWADVSAIAAESAGRAIFEGEIENWEQFDGCFLPGQRLVAASREGRIVGWAALEPVSRRPSLWGVASVSVFVGAAFRGQGFGRRLLTGLVGSADEVGFWSLQAYVLPQNLAAHHLFEELGFRSVGTLLRLVESRGVWHDVDLLERRASVPQAEPARYTPKVLEAS
jgi:phosphinothricin acetyltransferase